MTLWAIRPIVLALFIAMPLAAMAQTPPPPAAAGQQLLKSEELEALVAPIALYPDTLLSQVLIASTYPLEVVQADRWANTNKTLKGDQLKTEVDKQAWDESVKSLAATPSVLEMMSSKLDWTQKLGDAVLAQQPDVMDAIQRLRSKAHANNKLPSTKEQTVTVTQEQGRQVIAIAPTNPETIYVPYYDPAVVYGGWPYPAYPPYYWPAPGYIAGGVIATGLAFGAGYALGRWTSGGNFWGGGVNWGNNNINVNRPVNINNIQAKNWQHNPQHRHGVKYNNAAVNQKFRGSDAGRTARQDFRGKDGQKVLDPGRGGAGDRPGAGDRAGAGDRRGAGDRPGGDRAGAGKGASKGAGSKQASKGGAAGSKQASKGGGAKQASRPGGAGSKQASRPSGGRDTAFSGGGSGRDARAHANRGRQSYAGGGGGPRAVSRGGGGARSFGGGGGGGFRGGGGRGGGRRSDVALKHDIVLLGRLDNGLGFYRFAYNGSDRAYVGVMAQEVQTVMPAAVVRGRDGYLRVSYDRLGLTFQTYDQWIATGARVPVTRVRH